MVLPRTVEQVRDLPLDNGIRALQNGCTKLEKLRIHLRSGGLTDVGLGHIGKYSQNLRYLFLGFCGESDAELSKGCQKLQMLEINGCVFSELAMAGFMINVTSLRHLWIEDYHAFKNGIDITTMSHALENGHDVMEMALLYWNMELITHDKYFPDVPGHSSQKIPPSLLAYYSLADRRKDFPDSVIPIYSYIYSETDSELALG
uniref:Uncharacterized protein n=1 Tax=Tanacetum cinerariifolium TaxID=118510 RepID=A0A6L2MEX2_TANCI|nr:hypothetical protein [Tanacetum cinerariifolium]